MPRSLPIAVLALLLALPVHARAETQAAQGLPPQAFSADLVRIDAAGEGPFRGARRVALDRATAFP